MIPVPPLSVKFPDEERAKLKAIADKIGWAEGQVVRDAVTYVLHLIHHPSSEDPPPKLITLARLQLCHEQNPELLQQHIKRVHGALAKP